MKRMVTKFTLLLIVLVVAVSLYINHIHNFAINELESVVEEQPVVLASSEVEEIKKPIIIPPSTLPMTPYLLPIANSELRYEEPTHIVLHFTSNAFNNPYAPYVIEDIYHIFKDYGLSAHYVIDRSGEIYLFTQEGRVAYHAGEGEIKGYPHYELGLNFYSVGIELLAIGTREEMVPIITESVFNQINPSLLGYTEEQYQSLDRLIDDIIQRNPKIERNRLQIIGHDEYTERKTDPGSLFDWSKIGFE